VPEKIGRNGTFSANRLIALFFSGTIHTGITQTKKLAGRMPRKPLIYRGDSWRYFWIASLVANFFDEAMICCPRNSILI
jgi:hypothetical protein